MTAEMPDGAETANAQPGRVTPSGGLRTKGDELTVDSPGQRTRQFERVTLAATQQAA